MKKRFTGISVSIVLASLPILVVAQSFYLYPPKPTSADQLRLFANEKTCFGNSQQNGANAYSVSMANNHITITLSDKLKFQEQTSGFDFGAKDIDIGRLPAGQYTWSVEGENGSKSCHESGAPKNQPLTVTNARALKPTPFPLQDITGHWWNYTDSGTGIFFSHDEKDNVLGAWLTYDKNGAPKWYVFQPKWDTWESTEFADLYETSRPSGASLPAVGKTTLKAVGRARFFLQGNRAWNPGPGDLPNGRNLGQRFAFIYQFTDEPVKSIEMRRFTEATPQVPF
jgi:hypothetical protein